MQIEMRSGEALFGRPCTPGHSGGAEPSHQVGEGFEARSYVLPPRGTEAVRPCHVDVVGAGIVSPLFVDVAHPGNLFFFPVI